MTANSNAEDISRTVFVKPGTDIGSPELSMEEIMRACWTGSAIRVTAANTASQSYIKVKEL